MSHESEEAEHHEACEEAREAVGEGDDDSVLEGVVVELVVGGQCDQASPARPQGEEYLHSCVSPNLANIQISSSHQYY